MAIHPQQAVGYPAIVIGRPLHLPFMADGGMFGTPPIKLDSSAMASDPQQAVGYPTDGQQPRRT